ncbi:HdeD family acid-resistance protein [Rubritalea marina]|uniref:HdeD family acid-resistance protein n=1 Tax=Rubritalea marina TaxID=361055 RepID=UPI000364E3C8|nr:DUF308 domain-containing protein [Rubritalea marina]
MQSMIFTLLASTWWLILIRGLAFLAFGLLAFTTPLLTIGFLITYWAIYLLFDGGISLASTLSGKPSPGRGITKGTGILSIGIGLLFLLNPQLIAQFIIMMLGWILIFKGFVFGSIGLNIGFKNRGGLFLFFAAIASFFFGYWIISHPAAAAATMLRLFSIFAIIIGFSLTALALNLRKQFKQLKEMPQNMGEKEKRFDNEPFIDV